MTVALSGDAGDELFAGYANYAAVMKYQDLFNLVPLMALQMLSKTMRSRIAQRLAYCALSERDFIRLANGTTMISNITGENSKQKPFIAAELLVRDRRFLPKCQTAPLCAGNLVEQIMCRDTNEYLPGDILVKVDRASMAVGLEIRAPFADDVELFETAWQIPFRHKLDSRGGKLVLRKALERFVPRELSERRKMGFSIPLGTWFRGKLRAWAEDLTSTDRIAREGYLRPAAVERVRRKAFAGDHVCINRLWAICSFEAWLAAAASRDFSLSRVAA